MFLLSIDTERADLGPDLPDGIVLTLADVAGQLQRGLARGEIRDAADERVGGWVLLPPNP